MTDPRHQGIIVLGHPRSGTTLLRRLLDAHPRICCPGETHILNACARFLNAEITADGLDMGVLSGLSFAGFSDTEVLTRLREFAFAFPREYAQRQNKPRWAEKTAIDTFYIQRIEALCGDQAYFLGIIRHGLDVALSCRDLLDASGILLEELHRYVCRYPQLLEAFCHSWADTTRDLLAFADRHPENVLLCRYEDLVAAPTETLGGLMEFVGEDYAPKMLTGLRKVDELGMGDWKSYQSDTVDSDRSSRWQGLSSTQLTTLGAIVNPLLEELDYPLVPIQAGSDTNAARRRYELSLMAHASRQGR